MPWMILGGLGVPVAIAFYAVNTNDVYLPFFLITLAPVACGVFVGVVGYLDEVKPKKEEIEEQDEKILAFTNRVFKENELEKIIEKKDVRIEELESQCENFDRYRSDSRKLNQTKEQLGLITRQRDEFNTQLINANSELKTTKGNVASISGQHSRIVEELSQSKTQVSNLETELAEKKAEIEKLTEELQTVNSALKKEQGGHEETRKQKIKAANIQGANELSLDEFIPAFKNKLPDFSKEDFQAANSAILLELAVELNDSFKRHGHVTPLQAEDVPDHLKHINNIESVIDLYTQKMQRVKHDDELDEDEREMKLENWQRLMDKQVAEMEG